MHALITGSRIPIALEMIRKLGRSGHMVAASDSARTAPGNHSRYVQTSFVTSSPRYETHRYIGQIERRLKTHPVDILIPTFEEVFYLSRHRARLSPLAELFFPGFDLLRQLHDKVAFLDLARELKIPTHPSVTATSREELAEATQEFEHFIARAAYSRGGARLFTNAGPLAGRTTLGACAPTPTNPFLVQPFVPGRDICSHSIVHHGTVVAHACYMHPVMLSHSTGLAFESVNDPETLEIAQRLCEATGYHGQISIDFMRTNARLVAIECNPRPSFGLSMMPDEMFVEALQSRVPPRPRVAPAGVRRKMAFAVLHNVVTAPLTARKEVDALLHGGRDIFIDRHDLRPVLYQLAGFALMIRDWIARRHTAQSSFGDAFTHDTVWDGDKIN